MHIHRPVRRLGTLVAAAAVVVPVALAAPASAAATGTVSGTVVDDAGTPVAGLVVSARTGADAVLATARTASDGTYRLVAPTGQRAICFDGTGVATASGGYRFTCAGGPTAARATPVRVVAGATRAGVDGTVTRRAVVTGRVTDSTGPLTGVGIRVSYAGPVRTTTGADGRYRVVVDPVAQPSTAICFVGSTGTGGTSPAAGYVDQCSDPVPLAPGAVQVVDRVLTAGAGAAGRVTDGAGRPVVGATVQFIGPGASSTATTGANGTWRATGLEPGPTSIIVTPPDDAPGTAGNGLLPRCVGGATPGDLNVDCPGSTPTTLVAGRVTRGLDVVLPDASALSGRVTDDRGTPTPGVELVLRRNPSGGLLTVVSGTDGRWTVRDLPPGTDYGVCTLYDNAALLSAPDPDGYDSGCVTDGEGRNRQFTLTGGDAVDTGTLVLTGLGRAVGRVVDAVTGRGIAGADVAVQSPGGEPVHTTTGADGSYVVGDLRVGDNAYCAFADGVQFQPPLGYAGSCPAQYLTNTLIGAPTFTVVQRGDTTAPTIRLVQNGTLGGRVTDRSGFALRDVQVEIRSASSDDTAVVTTGTDGRWVSPPLRPGTFTVCFHGDDAARAVDGTHPANGYADECFDDTQQPTPVPVTAGRERRGVDAVLAPRPAS